MTVTHQTELQLKTACAKHSFRALLLAALAIIVFDRPAAPQQNSTAVPTGAEMAPRVRKVRHRHFFHPHHALP